MPLAAAALWSIWLREVLCFNEMEVVSITPPRKEQKMMTRENVASGTASGEPQIWAAARALLTNSGYRELAQVGCLCEADTVILHGVVSSYYLKQLAQAMLAASPLYGRIDNRIVVRHEMRTA
jgi:hypothetical protein